MSIIMGASKIEQSSI